MGKHHKRNPDRELKRLQKRVRISTESLAKEATGEDPDQTLTEPYPIPRATTIKLFEAVIDKFGDKSTDAESMGTDWTADPGSPVTPTTNGL